MSFVPAMKDAQGRLLDIVEQGPFKVACILDGKPVEVEVRLAMHLHVTPGMAPLEEAWRMQEMSFLLQASRFPSLAVAAQALCAWMLCPSLPDNPRSVPEAITLRLLLGGQSIQLHRAFQERVPLQETKDFGRVDIIHEWPAGGIYRLCVKPGGTIPTHVHRVMQEEELVLARGLLVQGRAVERGSAFAWPLGVPHRYDNPLLVEQAVLCVDRPSFIPGDEVVVDTPLHALQTIPGKAFQPGNSLHPGLDA